MVKQDQLWPGGFRFFFDDGLFQPGTDSFLLGSFPRLRRGARVCDLGAGTGLLGLLLLAREPSLQVTNVELQEAAVELARQNAALNCLSDRVANLRVDLRDKTRLPPAGTFDLVVSNPPYFDAARGAVAKGTWPGRIAPVHCPSSAPLLHGFCATVAAFVWCSGWSGWQSFLLACRAAAWSQSGCAWCKIPPKVPLSCCF